MKKVFTLLSVLIMFAASSFAKRGPRPEVKPITKGNFIYYASADGSNDHYFGTIRIEAVDEPKYFYRIPIYAIELDTNLERDVQWIEIQNMEFKDENTITIINEINHVFELNINTFEVKCVNTESNVFRYKDGKCISGNLNGIYEKLFENLINRNGNCKYKGSQPEVKKLTKLEDLVNVAEKVLIPIYGEEHIKGEQPYRIKRYKDKWIVTGTLPEGYDGGVFEIVINAETSQVESLIHGK
jgi:hypothetical protein